MIYATYQTLLKALRAKARHQAPGTVALVLTDGDRHDKASVEHCLRAGFDLVLALGPTQVESQGTGQVLQAPFDTSHPNAETAALNALIDALPGWWLHCARAGEFLFWPYCEHRDVGDLTAFIRDERRDSIAGCVVDLYPKQLTQKTSLAPGAPCWFDAAGYRQDSILDDDGTERPRERRLYGGLRLRFEDHIPETRRSINRILMFRARKGLCLDSSGRFSIPEYNTYRCPWHHNVTGVLASFRTATYLSLCPDLRAWDPDLHWFGTRAFDWSPEPLLKAGLMDPGQWV